MTDMLRLTYQDIADRLGIKKEAAKSRVRRAGWTRSQGNDGVMSILVPKDVFDTPVDGVSTPKRDTPSPTIDDRALTRDALDLLKEALKREAEARKAAEQQVVVLSERVGMLTAERDAARGQVERMTIRRKVKPTTPSPVPSTRWWEIWK